MLPSTASIVSSRRCASATVPSARPVPPPYPPDSKPPTAALDDPGEQAPTD